VWTQTEDKNTHQVTFRVSDTKCAYQIIADPDVMTASLPHVKGYEIHDSGPNSMEISITEVFVKLARGTSRYKRHFEGNHTISWKLLEGRQKMHDGEWVITADKEGGEVQFSNRIKAKKRFQQSLVRWVQKSTMKDIVRATRRHCGEG
jgi:ribosome-associated toxin RatA of RatAB toxin-antitoxin module